MLWSPINGPLETHPINEQTHFVTFSLHYCSRPPSFTQDLNILMKQTDVYVEYHWERRRGFCANAKLLGTLRQRWTIKIIETSINIHIYTSCISPNRVLECGRRVLISCAIFSVLPVFAIHWHSKNRSHSIIPVTSIIKIQQSQRSVQAVPFPYIF